MNIHKNLLFIGMAVLAINLTPAIATAQIVVNVDFNGTGGDPSPVTYTGQGALATSDAHFWNGVTIPATASTIITTGSLIASDDITNTGITVTLNDVYGYNFGNSGNVLVNDFAYNEGYTTGTASTFSINGLTPGASYNLYLYGIGGQGANSSDYFQIGATQQFVTGGGSVPPPWTAGTQYVLFSNVVADGTGAISGSWNDAAGNGAPFDGLQIQSTAVPEPSTIALLVFSGLGIACLYKLKTIHSASLRTQARRR